jgi:hypothetical protein
MKQAFFTALAATLAATGGAPALAQQTDRVLVLYGNDKCPTNANGEQIVVCTRRPEGERYRIPKELRSPIIITPENQSWATKANDTLNAGAAIGTGSCSAVGAGGWTGCWAQQMRDAKRQRQAQAAESTAVDTQVSRPR